MTPKDRVSRGVNQYYNIDYVITVKSCALYLQTNPKIARKAGTCLFALKAGWPIIWPPPITRDTANLKEKRGGKSAAPRFVSVIR